MGSSNFNSNKCFKCQGYGHIVSDYPNRKIVNIMKEKIVNEEDL